MWKFFHHERGLVLMSNIFSSLEMYNPGISSMEGMAAVVFYFTIYSFFGWMLENSYSLATNRIFFKANFLKGPFKPMYGFAPVTLVFLVTKEMHWSLMLLLCFFIPTLVEYVSGVMLQKMFQRQYWDYSNIPLQLHGHICLPFSLCWIGLSVFCIKYIHPAVASIFGAIESIWVWAWPLVLIYFLVELVLAIRRHSTQVLPN
jgi:uncharacterized membrane protein